MNLDIFDRGYGMTMLALDHRGSFEKAMHEAYAIEPSINEIRELKSKIIYSLQDYIAGVLIDEDYGLPAYQSIKASIPYLLPIEKSGYTDSEAGRVTEITRSTSDLIKLGAKGAKLLLYVNTKVESWNTQMQIAREAIEDAHNNHMPLFLEFVLYEANGYKDSVYDTVKLALDEGVFPHVWKLPYPGNEEECMKVTALLGNTPWIMLTGGVSFEDFYHEYKIAKSCGAKGFLAGRALWQEACNMYKEDENLEEFLNYTLKERILMLLGA